jgi:uncharacterized protein (TIGR02266 family)
MGSEETQKKILIVDDTALFRELEATFLSRAGQVLVASEGHEAFEIARREQPDLVIIDLDLVGMQGDTLCMAIKADRDLHRTPVILVTAGPSAQDHERAVRAHADDVIAKPLTRIQLRLAASRLLSNGRHPGLARVTPDDELRVRVGRDGASSWGVVRDLSRGGVFVESHGKLPTTTEVDLDFRLPNARMPLRPTAQVRWTGVHPRTGVPGMGLRFVALDRSSTSHIDDYVYERSVPEPRKPPSPRTTD